MFVYLRTCILAFLPVFVINVLSDPAPACKLTDPGCLDKISVKTYSNFIEADPELKTESLDPMYYDYIMVKLSLLHTEFTDTTVNGFKDCKMENVTLNPELKLHFDLQCPKLVMIGKYIITGKLIVLPVEGTGDYRIETKKYNIAVDAFLTLVTGEDGYDYVMIKDFKQKAEPLEPIVYDFKNLFNGEKELADIVIRFANENWLDVAKEVDGPVINADLKKIFKNANKYFKTVPVEISAQ